MSLDIAWTWVFLDSLDGTATGAFWSGVTRSTVSAVRGVDGEFTTLLPARGDAWVKVQTVRDGGGTHLDLDVPDPRAAAALATSLGALVTGPEGEDGYVALRSPGGYPFCLTTTGPPRQQVRDGEPDLLDQVCLDIPADRFDAEVTFWEALTGWSWVQSRVAEFGYLQRPAGQPLRLLTQRLGEPSGAVRGHVDLACADRAATRDAHVASGSVVLAEHAFWTVLADPTGRQYCLTDRSPTQDWVG